MKRYPFVVIGAGSAGRTAAEVLADALAGTAGRIGANDRSILLVSDESPLPYKRTQVDKHVASGYGTGDFAVHESAWYGDSGIDLITGAAADRLDAAAHTVFVGGEEIGYGSLLLATGARPAKPFGDFPADRASTLWDIRDGLAVNKALKVKKSVIVVGSGPLGVETAWQATLMGLETTLISRSRGLMHGSLDGFGADCLQRAAEASGVRIHLGREISGVRTEGPHGVTVRTAAGETFRADYAVLAAGSNPETELARTAGLGVQRGILVDDSLRTTVPGIWAAGDCAEHPGGQVTGLWHAAENQGRLAAESMLGRDVRNENPPFRLKCEVFGGYWFSAGPVAPPEGADGRDGPETWEFGGIVWRPRFVDGRLEALSAVAESGMEKSLAKKAQALATSRASRNECAAVLRGDASAR